MRNYIVKANVGALPDSIISTKFGAGEFNSIAAELENSVTRSGQTLAPADGTSEDTTQLAQSLFLHAVKSESFQDSGSANAYILTPVSGSSGVLLPGNYDNLNGAVIRFTPANAATGASTVNIGQTAGTLLGVKKILTASGAELSAGDLPPQSTTATYDSTADSGAGAWLLNTGTTVFPYHAGFIAGVGQDGAGTDLAVQRYGQIILGENTTITGVIGYADVGPTGAAINIDIRRNGTAPGDSIFNTAPTIAAAANSLTNNNDFSGPATSLDLNLNDRLYLFVTQVGSTVAGQSLSVTMQMVTR